MAADLIPVDPDNPYPLGRAGVHHDPRNWQHLALVQPPTRRSRPGLEWWTRDVYDQGRASSCTAQAAVGVLRTFPFRRQFTDHAGYDTADERHALYLEAQRHDPWPGEQYDGSSTDAPFKVFRDRGHISSWRWLMGEAELREWVTWYGPAAVGTVWHRDMFTPDRRGYIAPTGEVAGGHAYRIVQFHQRRHAYRVVNSWGRDWGQAGRAWITAEDMAGLLADRGEAATVG